MLKVWKAEGMTTFEFADQSLLGQQDLLSELQSIKTEIEALKGQIKK